MNTANPKWQKLLNRLHAAQYSAEQVVIEAKKQAAEEWERGTPEWLSGSVDQQVAAIAAQLASVQKKYDELSQHLNAEGSHSNRLAAAYLGVKARIALSAILAERGDELVWAAADRMQAWAEANGQCDTQGIEESEWHELARAALGTHA